MYIASDYQPYPDERELERCPICEDLLAYGGAPCSCFFA